MFLPVEPASRRQSITEHEETRMSNLTLWSRPAWDVDRWMRDFFGPASAADWAKPVAGGFSPAAEIVKDGEDAVVRLELPGVDVDKDVNAGAGTGPLSSPGGGAEETP